MSKVSTQRENEILKALNPQQREAVLHDKGPLLILAGAGSGKTRTITHRIAYLTYRGYPPDSILAITFTNKAAGEMKERTLGLCGLESRWISTFHSFAARLLRRNIHQLSPFDNSFSIYDTDDTRSLLKVLIKELDIDPHLWTPQAAQAEISRLKNNAKDTSEELFGADFVHGQALRTLFLAYRERLEQRNALDFDDLLLFTVRLFREHPDVLERYQKQFSHVLIDEYQDTNSVQYQISNLLSQEHRNICITGDPDQSIYGWRGADIRNILNFEHDHPDARVVKLEQNYRSTKNILHVANGLIAHNQSRKAKDLWTENASGEPVRVYLFDDERAEAGETVALIQRMLQEGTPAGDVAIFYRINSLSRPIEEELIYASIPYNIVGGTEFFQRLEVKDILAYLQILDNPRDTESLNRIINVPRRGIGKTSLEKLNAASRSRNCSLLDVVLKHADQCGLNKPSLSGVNRFAKLYRELKKQEKGRVAKLLETVMEQSGYFRHVMQLDNEDDRMANLGELVNAGKEYDKAHPDGSLTGFLENVRLLSSVDRWKNPTECITLMTLHSAKGLEFPVVVIAGVEEGLLPLLRADDPEPDLEEERRLLYVGITRAQERLYITHVSYRMRFGESRRSYPSRFLYQLQPPIGVAGESQALELDEETKVSLIGRRKYDPNSTDDDFEENYGDHDEGDLDEDPYPIGARVFHDDYGEGEIVRVTGFGRQRRVMVEFDDAGRKQFVLGYAPLRRIR